MQTTTLSNKTTVKKTLYATLSSALLSLSLIPVANAVTDKEFQTLKDQFNQLADKVENNNSTTSQTTLGGYGELHYTNLSNGKGTDKKVLDLHRFVLFINHEFNAKTRFFSEFEIEHTAAGTGKAGEVAVEQAYVQFDLNDNTQLNTGVFLVPIGIINETHEPPTFYGVERNPIEKYIIPTTWSESGVMLSSQQSSGFSYNIALTSGLNVDPVSLNLRSSRQDSSQAKANNLAITAQIKYTGIRGLEVAGTVQRQDDITQNSSDNVGGATLIETHARYSVNDFTFTGLYARWDISGVGASSIQKNVQDGVYLEAAYKITPKIGLFARQNQWDNGGAGDTKKAQTNIGFNYWPEEDVVIKADYQAQNAIAGNFDGINIGMGYQF